MPSVLGSDRDFIALTDRLEKDSVEKKRTSPATFHRDTTTNGIGVQTLSVN